MKLDLLFGIALISMIGLAPQDARAGSAVALSEHNHMIALYGHPVEVAKQRALDEARHKYGPNVRLFGYTDVDGYGAIVAGRNSKAEGWIVSAALGRRSQTEAVTMARNQCLRAGGKNPRVLWSFKG